MIFHIVTCNTTRHIIPAQLWLFKRYAPDHEVKYLDMKDYPIKDWCKNVANCLEQVKDKYIYFGLDDYLPIDYLMEEQIPISSGIMEHCDRLGIGYGCRLHQPVEPYEGILKYTPETPYQASCQFSVWNRESLIRVLKEVDGSPWDFEIKGRCRTFALKEPAFRWIEESALSKRQPEKVNVLGLRPDDVNELVNLGFLDPDKIIYGWNGHTTFKPEYAGEKYGEFYV